MEAMIEIGELKQPYSEVLLKKLKDGALKIS